MNKNIKPYVPISNFPLKLACVYSNYSSNLPKNNTMAYKGDIEGIKKIIPKNGRPVRNRRRPVHSGYVLQQQLQTKTTRKKTREKNPRKTK